jgi:hypothetical protein
MLPSWQRNGLHVYIAGKGFASLTSFRRAFRVLSDGSHHSSVAAPGPGPPQTADMVTSFCRPPAPVRRARQQILAIVRRYQVSAFIRRMRQCRPRDAVRFQHRSVFEDSTPVWRHNAAPPWGFLSGAPGSSYRPLAFIPPLREMGTFGNVVSRLCWTRREAAAGAWPVFLPAMVEGVFRLRRGFASSPQATLAMATMHGRVLPADMRTCRAENELDNTDNNVEFVQEAQRSRGAGLLGSRRAPDAPSFSGCRCRTDQFRPRMAAAVDRALSAVSVPRPFGSDVFYAAGRARPRPGCGPDTLRCFRRFTLETWRTDNLPHQRFSA